MEILLLIISILTLIVAVITLWPILADYHQKKRKKKIFERKEGFGPYDEMTIERSINYYIRPKCSNLDPAQEKEIRHALIATREDLFSKIDYFLDNPGDCHHLLILADSGTGKTSFVINYFDYNWKRPKHLRKRIFLMPLGQPNVDQSIKDIKEQNEAVIFLDALDEDTKAIEDHRQRILDLMILCSHFQRVIITCRTQFFPKDEEIPVETGLIKLAPKYAGNRSGYDFLKLYLSPFDDQEIKRFFNKRFPIWKKELRREALQIARTIPFLSARPMLLAHIPDILKRNLKIDTISQLYKIMVDAWLIRETPWVEAEKLRQFSELFAKDVFINREKRGYEGVPREELAILANQWHIDLKSWQLSSRSLLNRDAKGIYKFAHRSIMEYFYIIHCIKGDLDCIGYSLTDQMKEFLVQHLLGYEKYAFRDYYLGVNFYGVITKIDKKVLENYFDFSQFVSFIKSYFDVNSIVYNDPDWGFVEVEGNKWDFRFDYKNSYLFLANNKNFETIINRFYGISMTNQQSENETINDNKFYVSKKYKYIFHNVQVINFDNYIYVRADKNDLILVEDISDMTVSKINILNSPPDPPFTPLNKNNFLSWNGKKLCKFLKDSIISSSLLTRSPYSTMKIFMNFDELGKTIIYIDEKIIEV